jgi:hypothetical protein
MRGTIFKVGDKYGFALLLHTSDYIDHKTGLMRSGRSRQVKRSGFTSYQAAYDAKKAVERLVDLVKGTDPDAYKLRCKIGDIIVDRGRRVREGVLDLPDEDEIKRRLGLGMDPTTAMPTLGAWFDTWLRARERRVGKNRQKASTVSMYRSDVERFWRPQLGEIVLNRLTPEHIEGVLDWIERRNAVVN